MGLLVNELAGLTITRLHNKGN